MKTLKEYISGFSIGPTSHMAPIASLGDLGDNTTKRAVGLNANYRSVKGTYKPIVNK